MFDDEEIGASYLIDVKGLYARNVTVHLAFADTYPEVMQHLKGYNPIQVNVYDTRGKDVTYKFVSNVL